jgi:hypothetical protein
VHITHFLSTKPTPDICLDACETEKAVYDVKLTSGTKETNVEASANIMLGVLSAITAWHKKKQI